MAYGVLSYISRDQSGKDYREPIGTITLSLTDTATRLTNATKIDTFSRAVNSLTTNTYQDAEVVTTESINDILIEEAGE